MPFQLTVRTVPAGTCDWVQVWTTAPSDWRIKLTMTSCGAELSSLKLNTTPRCEPRYQRAAEVAVWNADEPGAAESSGCGWGGGGGRIFTGLVGCDWTPPEATAWTGPVCAAIGTATTTAFALCAFTVAAFAAPFVPLPWTPPFMPPSRFWPVIWAVAPPWIRLLGAQWPTHVTAATVGSGA